MKNLYSIFVFCLITLTITNHLHSQASNCFNSYLSPFCSGIAQYPANFDGTGSGSGPQAPAGPNYDCLGTQGNPTYFSLTIEQTGSIYFTLDNTANVDIDFILWGPFSSIADAQAACDSMGQGGQWGNVDTCSYSSIAQEPVSISNAQAGEVYILMVTNYANIATNIFSTPGTGTGSVACPCDIPYAIDTLSAINGNQGFIADTLNGINQFVVCPGNTLGIEIGAKASLNDTLSLYGPFTTVNNAFANNTVFSFNPNAPSFYDSLTIYTLVTPTITDIGLTNFTIGMQNNLYTGGLTDSSCFDQLSIQVVVPGVIVNDIDVCSGEILQLNVDSIPTTSLGASSYNWSQVNGPTITFSSVSEREPTITIPISSSNSSSDSIVLVVDYTYGNLCTMSDTMVLHFPDMSINASANPDSICLGESSNLIVNLTDTLTPALCDDYNVSTIPFNPLSTTGTLVNNFTALSFFSSTDEGISAALPIGFNFNFYCNNYSNFYIHTNGFITFDNITGTPGLLTGSTIPDANIPNNLIALSWEDLDVANGGNIQYYVQGVSPNRKLVVSFTSIETWIGGNSMTSQAILYENDNSIEIHITNNNLFTSTIGIEDFSGTTGHYHSSLTQGQSLGNITNTAYRFEPKTFGPFYTWTPNNTLNSTNIHDPTATPNVYGTTTYAVLVNDGICTYIDSTNVTVVTSLPATVLTCDSATVNSISFSWSDIGLPAGGYYEYSIDSGQTWINVGTNLSTTINNLLSGTNYYIIFRANDGQGGPCSVGTISNINCATSNADCNNNPDIIINLNPLHLTCNNDSSGCINATVTGGSGSIMGLNWSNGITSNDSICQLTAGHYTLVVTDTIGTGLNPTICIDSAVVTLTEPLLLEIIVDTIIQPSCKGYENGAIDISINGGSPNYNYLWSNNSINQDLDSLGDNIYTVTVTDINGCVSTTSVNIFSNDSIAVSINSIIGMLSCDALPIGSLQATAIGGTGFLYTWNNGTSGSMASGLPAGNYTVTATNSNGCIDSASSSIIAPTLPQLNPYVSITGLQSVAVPIGTIVTISAGTPGLTYNWTGSSDPISGNLNITNPSQQLTTVSPDPEGIYTYIISASLTTNDTTCTSTDSIIVIVEAPFKGFSNAFSPNGDGVNDYFAPITLSDNEVTTFRIFNRWGQLVYNGDESHGNGWDGKLNGVDQPIDSYIYLVIYQKASDPEPITVRGEFTLLR
ncbi:MAG: gliding motility-associated C-terminal domain-containing protein [Saprospiraceae bacterium]|nr:gliding motility-associated C-terminal domain-containing protein [Saprospiraceae bacterium]